MDTFIVEFCYKNVSVKEDGNNFTASCRICPNKTISGSIRSSSNFLKHVKVRHPLRFQEYERRKDVTWKKKKRVLAEYEEAAASSTEAEASPSVSRDRQLSRNIKREEDGRDSMYLGSGAVDAGSSLLEPETSLVVCSADTSPTATEVTLHQDSMYEQDIEQLSIPTPIIQQVPWSGFEKAFTFVRQKGKNVIVQCNYCLPAIKNVSSAITSASNVKKHLERAHPDKLRAIEIARKARRRGHIEKPVDYDDDPSPVKMPKQEQEATLERGGSGRELVTQRILDQKIMDFIVEETLPLQTVDKSTFIGLVRLGLPKDLTVMCAKTLRDRIEKRTAGMQETLAHRMGAVAYVATTADCWTDGKKSFLGVTAHWICPTTLKPEFGALACKRLQGCPTYDVLAKALHDVHVQYRIHNKVVSTTTDSSANFAKAFRVFKAKEPTDAADTSADDDDDDQEEAEVDFVPISEILETGNRQQGESVDTEDFGLPPHQRCASHTLNLVATEDIQAMVSDSPPNSPLGSFRKLFCSFMGKCSKLWSKQSQSAQIAEYIYEQCGVYLKIPSKARWGSTFDALKQLNELLSTVPEKVDAIMDQCSLARITPAESLVVQEYTEIMGPLAQSLDILQRENGMFMGYLLPTLYNLDRKLQGLENKPVRYTYCLQLLRGVREALRKRFAPIWEDRKLLLAACLHPRFKVDWLESAQTAQTNRYMMEALLKAEIRGTVGEENDESLEKDQEGDDLEDDFFNIQPRGRKSAVDTADEEVLRYLKSPSREVSCLHAFPRVLRCFLQFNTGMPSSAAVERLFSTGGSIFTVKRHALSDELFEQLVLLKQNMAASAF
ncbi:uncharacterized protein LOC121921827 isoform X2 [Sceloporus undulatus]|nr:uncharacterized protein LOC121921827 isoform X2 [Sceloporus undulatus]